ncbi:hypothetical protein NM688_g5090 [Phlebia brevispora]|uniref:Uncharacterized protein n=1 Tax=Phlebia brevispora TaxID=194682 RepID=A0ACC1T111_9APHY|nr:hypothetical protein NM688_g5090 [Phlebia brevispora]
MHVLNDDEDVTVPAMAQDPFADPVPDPFADHVSEDVDLNQPAGEHLTGSAVGAPVSPTSQPWSGGTMTPDMVSLRRGSETSVHALGLGSGNESSSANGHSSSDHGVSGSGSGPSSHSHSDPSSGSQRHSVPSSLLPTLSGVPPSSYPLIDDTVPERKPKRTKKKNIVRRPLRWVKSSYPTKDDEGSVLPQVPPPIVIASPRKSPPTSEIGGTTPILSSPVSSSSHSSVVRSPKSTFPSSPFAPHIPIPPPPVPGNNLLWPGLDSTANVPLPSPALTEYSTMHMPDGLLDSDLRKQLNEHAMRSTGAISLRDDMDYSRRIGGLVNNLTTSSTTLPTIDTRPPSIRAPSTRRNSVSEYSDPSAVSSPRPL